MCSSCCCSVSSSRTFPAKMFSQFILVFTFRARCWWFSFIILITPVTFRARFAVQRCYLITVIPSATTPTNVFSSLVLLCSFWAWNWWLSFIIFITPMTFWANFAIKRSYLVTIIAFFTSPANGFSTLVLLCSFWAWSWWFSFITFITPITFWANFAIKRSYLVTIIAFFTRPANIFLSLASFCPFCAWNWWFPFITIITPVTFRASLAKKDPICSL